jgi:predicted MFS family arabinose efflux permease
MEDRTKSLLVLCLINFVGGSGYSIMTPLFPPLVNHRGISEAVTGYIFCLYPVGAIIVSLILGATMELKTMKSVLFIRFKKYIDYVIWSNCFYCIVTRFWICYKY